MVIRKIFNNNCVSVDIKGVENIVTGNGVGFGKQIGQRVEISKIEKQFEIKDENRSLFEELIKNTDIRYMNLSRQIIEYAESVLTKKIDNKVNISLTDHIVFAMDRYEKGIHFPPLFDTDVKAFYPQEYEIGLWALAHIKAVCHVQLPIEEAAYIAMHIINASSVTNVSDFAQRITAFIHDSLQIIAQSEGIVIDKNAMEISRLVVHLKYLGNRIFTRSKESMEEEMQDISDQLLPRFSSTSKTVDRLAEYIKSKYDYTIDKNEHLYLSIHLYQILNKYRFERR